LRLSIVRKTLFTALYKLWRRCAQACVFHHSATRTDLNNSRASLRPPSDNDIHEHIQSATSRAKCSHNSLPPRKNIASGSYQESYRHSHPTCRHAQDGVDTCRTIKRAGRSLSRRSRMTGVTGTTSRSGRSRLRDDSGRCRVSAFGGGAIGFEVRLRSGVDDHHHAAATVRLYTQNTPSKTRRVRK
jgi:hypothetical protein